MVCPRATLPLATLPKWTIRPGHHRLGIAHLDEPFGACHLAGIAHLAATLGVEGRPHHDNLDAVALLYLVDHLVAGDKPDGHRGGCKLLVAQKRGSADTQALVQASLRAVASEPGRGAGPLALGLHLPLESLQVHFNAVLAGDLLSHLHREAIGVPEPEHYFALDRLGLFQLFAEDGVAVLVRQLELLLLQPEHSQYEVPVVAKLGIDGAHLLNYHLGNLAKEGVLQPEATPVAYGTAYDPAQHVAPPFVPRHDAVGYQKRGAAPVLDHNPHGVLGVGVTFVALSTDLLNLLDNGREQIGLVEGLGVLLYGDEALQAHTGVDARARKGRSAPVQVVVVLHEDQVPQLDVPLAYLARVGDVVGAVGAAVLAAAAWALIAEVVVQLGARARRALVSSRSPPVLFVAEAEDALGRDAMLLPEPVRIIIGLMDRG